MELALHGRDGALRTLRGALDGALVGRGRLVVVSGEAGIGKSALAAVISREAEGRGVAVTSGRAWEFADAPPYLPVWPCLRSLGIEIAATGDGTALPFGSAARERVPAVETHAFHLWESVLAALAQQAATAPVMWLVEDLHAADLGTLDLLTFLAQPLHAMRVLVVATARAEDPRLTDRMNQRLARMARDGVDLRLEPLTEHEIVALTEETLGREVPASAVHRLVELTGGNPLFVVECARAFRSAGGVEGTLASLPPTVRQVVLDRVTLLPDATRQALASGAVIGREFSAAIVARMAQSLPARIIDSLLPALRAGLVRETKPGHFIFSHTLVRDAIEDALAAADRAELHGRVGAALAHLGETSENLVERARHAIAALRGGNASDALELATRAADLLEREGAFDRAFELHVRARDARAAGLFPAASPAHELHVARIARAAGRSEMSRRMCDDVIGAARASGNGELLARASLLRCADVRPGVIDRSQVTLLEEARALLGTSHPALGCRVLARLATALQPAPDQEVPAAVAREALQRAHELGDDALIIDVLELAGWGIYGTEIAERLAWSGDLLDRALAANDLPKALTAYSWRAFLRIEARDFAAFDRDTASMLALSEELGHPRHRWAALLAASGRAITVGRFAESDRYVTEVAQLAALNDDPAIGLALATHELMRVRAIRRDAELASVIARFDREMRGVTNGSSIGAVLRATTYARLEDVDATREQLALIGGAAAMVSEDFMLAGLLGEAYAVVGTDVERRRIRDMVARPRTAELTTSHAGYTYEGTATRVLGLLDAALGDLVGAERELREAYELAVARGHLPMVAQLAYELAKLANRTGNAAEARIRFDEASRIARELGMMGLERSIHAGVGVRPEPDASVTMSRDGEIWSVHRGTVVARVKDSRGMRLLARLVERPSDELHVLALATDDGASVPESSAGDVLDERARKAYRQRLADLDDELAAAEQRGDARRAVTIERERDALHDELARAAGIGGRVRQAKSATERARVNVQKRLRDAIARIAEADADLGRFFDRAVRTGTFCCFRP